MKWAVFLLAASVAMCAADLESIRQTQQKLFAQRGLHEETRGATAELTVLKHQIRDWVESRLAKLNNDADFVEFSARVDNELNLAKLIQTDEFLQLGDIDGVSVERPKGDATWLFFKTTVGIDRCGRDTSVYLYEWRGGAWARRFEFESDPTASKYGPVEFVSSLEVSPPDEYQQRRVLLLGNSWGCASNWQSVSLQLFRFGGQTTRLIDEDFFGYMGDDNPYQGRLEPDGVLFEYLGQSHDIGVLIRRHTLRYKVDGDHATLAEEPVLNAQDFVDGWLSSHREELTKEESQGLDGFRFVQHCSTNRAQWQVAFDVVQDQTFYFLVEDLGEAQFKMVDISKKRQKGCPGKDPPRLSGPPFPSLFPAEKKP